MTDPAGYLINYTYASRNLVSVNYQNGTEKIYHYENTIYPHHLTGVTDENGNRFASFSYDSNGRAISTQHAGGAGLYTLAFNTDGTTTVVDPLQTSRIYHFQTILGVKRLKAIAGGPCDRCKFKSVSYDANGNIASVTDFNGNITNYAFDSVRNLEISRTEASGTPKARIIASEYDEDYPYPSQITETGKVTSFDYDNVGNLLTVTISADNKSRKWAYTYDERGKLLTVNGPRTDADDIASYSYDELGNLSTFTDALGYVTRYSQYNAFGQPLRIEYPNGRVALISYDLRGRVTEVSQGGLSTYIEQTGAGDISQVTNPDGSFIRYIYDDARRLTGIEDAAGNRIEYTVDAMGNWTAERVYDAGGALVRSRTRVYNALGRLEGELDAQQNATHYGYDGNGNVVSVTDPLSNVTGREFDAFDRLVRITDAAQGMANYTYDSLDHLIGVQDPRGLATSYIVDGLGNLSGLISPDTGVTSRTHDAQGNTVTSVDARGIVATFSYDALNRLKEGSYSDGTLVSYEYENGSGNDPVGRLIGMTDPSGNTNWQYDTLGRVVLKRQSVGGISLTLERSYNNQGQLTQVSYPSGRLVRYEYDQTGRVKKLSVDAQIVLSGATYQAFGPVSSWTWGNGTRYARSFDLNGRITDFPVGSDAFGLGFDAAGRITTMIGGGSRSFSYDRLGRLTGYTGPSGSEAYSYDANGNRLDKISSGTTAYEYSQTSNRLLRIYGASSQVFSYDMAGNISSDITASYTYDGRGRMTVAATPSATANYKINGLGQRVSKVVSGVASASSRIFMYDDAGHLIGEYSPSGAPLQETLWLEDIPVGTVDASGVISYVFSDHLGTPRALTTAQGLEVWRWNLDPFGTGGANEDPDGDQVPVVYNLRFPGQYFDAETGLFQNWHRDYNPNRGRYIESDPIGLLGGINTYSYVGGNPVSYIDPTGLADYLTFNGSTLSGYVSLPQPIDSSLIGLGRSHVWEFSVPATSGPWGAGRLPEGTYGGRNLRQRSNAAMKCPDGNGWSLDLDDKDGRSLLRVHPDGNVPGTLGCVGVICGYHNQVYDSLRNGLMTNGGTITLDVDYGT